ncbi:hypothetical protein [Desulfovibrio inopinatus]|uniref:hypothetical protein n=1 Tax=Desulfovibrio inopinatus TaxID=102109 RepID=UPI00041E9AC8|nr:hypothetical protein [Desulfovibrio inopinatus]
MSMVAEFIDSTTFSVQGDQTGRFLPGVRVRADCGVDGVLLSTVDTSSYSSGVTTVLLVDGYVTGNLSQIEHGTTNRDSLVRHTHDASDVSGEMNEEQLPYRMDQDVRSLDPVQFYSMKLKGTLVIDPTGNAVIELGRIDGLASVARIDFHSGELACDYDTRIIASGGNGTAGNGDLTLVGKDVIVDASEKLVIRDYAPMLQLDDISAGAPVWNVCANNTNLCIAKDTDRDGVNDNIPALEIDSDDTFQVWGKDVWHNGNFTPSEYHSKIETVAENVFSFMLALINEDGTLKGRIVSAHDTVANENNLIPFDVESSTSSATLQSTGYTNGLAAVETTGIHVKSSYPISPGAFLCIASLSLNSSGTNLNIRPYLTNYNIGGDTSVHIQLVFTNAESGLRYNVYSLPVGKELYVNVFGYA